MELREKILITSAVLGFFLLAFVLRTWVNGGRQDSFIKVLRDNLLVFLGFLIVFAVVIYINN